MDEWNRESFPSEAEARAFASGLTWGDDPEFVVDAVEPCMTDDPVLAPSIRWDVVFIRREFLEG